ncbi:MAG: tetratricopeptide repeat protein [Bacteroidales bacterium]|nr:tetratricopeptide repeat protein [Bacteroidales bacterium]
MSLHINRDTIIEFLFDTLSQEKMSFVADAIVKNVDLMHLYKEIRKKIITQNYINKKLRRYDRINFEYKIKKSEHLLKMVSLQNTNNSLKDLNFKETLSEIYNESKSQKRSGIFVAHSINSNYNNWLVAASISVFLILGGGITYLFHTNNALESRLYATNYNSLDYTDSYLLNSSSFNVAKQKYMDGEYVNALELLNRLPSSLNIVVERDFFIGLSLMELGKYDNAIEYFEQIISSKNGFEYTPQIRWYMGLCYLKTGSKEKAIETFNTIVSNKEYNSKKAKKILRKLSI